ncbi:hypothetical protein EDD22DRAFT_893211 [Suillus occidentalis]|nr:hypothetical protein EDD22DRAFT_893211 [Suillus occidentalis]
MRTTRNSSVYLPSNVHYLTRNNGSEGGVDEALQKLVDSAWLVFGIGFYLACPFSVPIDLRCRLVGQKMNPSRIYTPRSSRYRRSCDCHFSSRLAWRVPAVWAHASSLADLGQGP